MFGLKCFNWCLIKSGQSWNMCCCLWKGFQKGRFRSRISSNIHSTDTFPYLFHRPQQPAIAVDHHQHRQTQAENEEADDVGVWLGWPSCPRHRATSSCALCSIAAPAQQGGHGPEQGIEPGTPNSEQWLAVVWTLLVVHRQCAVAVIGEYH